MANIRQRKPDVGDQPATQACIVHKAPASPTDPLTVVVPSFHPEREYTVKRWQGRGGTLPAKGDHGLLAEDEAHEPWLIAWWPQGGDEPPGSGPPGPPGEPGPPGPRGLDGGGGSGGGVPANDKGFVFHDTDSTVARPTDYASIEWLGSVEPTNAIDGDTWIAT